MTDSSRSPSSADAFDELAAMFLTEPDSPPHASLRSQSSFRELLIVGNLPVRSGLWLTPYADAIARANGPTALVRLDLKPATLELLRTPGETRYADGERSAASLRQAVMRAAPDVAVWIIRGPLHRSASDMAALDFDRLTILTSADSAAVAAALQIVEDLAQLAAQPAGHDGNTLPPIALAVVGATNEAAAEMVRRVGSAAAGFGAEVSLAVCMPRMDSGIRCTTFAGFSDDAAPGIDELLDWIDEAEDREAAPPEPAAPPLNERPLLRLAPLDDDDRAERAALLGDSLEDDRASQRPAHVEIHTAEREALLDDNDIESPEHESLLDDEVETHSAEPEPPSDEDDLPDLRKALGAKPLLEATPASDAAPAAAPAHAVAPEPDHVAPMRVQPAPSAPAAPRPAAVASSRVKLAPKPSARAAPPPLPLASRTGPLPGALASFVSGLSPLPVRCPLHEDVELAVDATRCVHVLAREASLRDIRSVEHWARTHANILSMACPDHEIDAAGDVVSHVFTDEPARVADLHGTGLRLHVLAPVRVAGRTAWYAAPLSR